MKGLVPGGAVWCAGGPPPSQELPPSGGGEMATCHSQREAQPLPSGVGAGEWQALGASKDAGAPDNVW